MRTLGESLIDWLEAYGIDTVFGIPGVHTVELYRGLAGSGIRHVTPRHEQGAGFMADGYARATGRVAAAFVITGPGLTNILTPMAQAFADSIPMLVVSSVNRTSALGMGAGDLHEIRNQGLIAAQAAAFSHTITDPAQMPEVMARAWAVFDGARPRPVHIQVPVDLLGVAAGLPEPPENRQHVYQPRPHGPAMLGVAEEIVRAERPLILCGGGALAGPVGTLAERIDAPLVMTTNGRGIVAHDHPLSVPASGSLEAVRALVDESDVVLAIGTELGRTDYNVYDREPFQVPGRLIHVDIDPEQLARGDDPRGLVGSARGFAHALLDVLDPAPAVRDGARRAMVARQAAWEELGGVYRCCVEFLDLLRDTLPEAPVVGDSTQAIYAGNLYYGAAAKRRWFNAATGYGALGYGLPAAIGAARGLDRAVICIAGDGGLQFSMADLGTAVEERLPVIVLVWNNRGYGEIKQFMMDRQITPVGVDLHTPDFVAIGRAYGADALRLERLEDLPEELRAAARREGPTVIEIDEGLVIGEGMG